MAEKQVKDAVQAPADAPAQVQAPQVIAELEAMAMRLRTLGLTAEAVRLEQRADSAKAEILGQSVLEVVRRFRVDVPDGWTLSVTIEVPDGQVRRVYRATKENGNWQVSQQGGYPAKKPVRDDSDDDDATDDIRVLAQKIAKQLTDAERQALQGAVEAAGQKWYSAAASLRSAKWRKFIFELRPELRSEFPMFDMEGNYQKK